MRLLGVLSDGTEVFDVPLEHGASPRLAAWDAGYRLLRPVDAGRGPEDQLFIRLRVAPRGDGPRPPTPSVGRDRDLVIAPGEVAKPRQRVAAYAVVLSDRGLLATCYSAKTAADGRWGMPGGGIDAEETPRSAVLREVHEETAQTVALGELITVETGHWIGRSPSGHVEDFHAVRLVYGATCEHATDPVVLDSEGTTSDARWVSLSDWRSLNWTVGWFQILSELLTEN